MSQENVEIVRRLYEAMNSAGVAAIYNLPDAERKRVFEQWFSPSFEIRQDEDLVFDTKGTFRGYEGFVESARELVEAFSDLRFEPSTTYESGDTVVFEVRALATGRGSGVLTEIPQFAHLWELKDGLVRRWYVYKTVKEALAAAGM